MSTSPTLVMKNLTPKEAWSGSKPSVHHFRVFYCLAHVYVSDAHKKKLDGKIIKCVNLGVNEESMTYKLYYPVERKVIIGDIMFHESKSWSCNKKEHAQREEPDSNTDDESDIVPPEMSYVIEYNDLAENIMNKVQEK